MKIKNKDPEISKGKSLFDSIPGFTPGSEFIHYRDTFAKPDVRRFTDKMFNVVEHFIGDPHFKKMIQTDFHEAVWQLYVTWVFHSFGKFPLVGSSQEGPDVVLKDGTIVEAILCRRGNGVDKPFSWSEQLPQYKDEHFTIHHPVNFKFPDPQIMLRVTNAISEKVKQHKKWIEDKIVDPGQPFIIAINAGQVDEAKTDHGISYASIVAFALGENIIEVSVDKVTGSTDPHSLRNRTLYKPFVEKKSGAKVLNGPFLSADFANISGLLFSPHCIDNVEALGPPSDLELVINGFAKAPLREDLLPGVFRTLAHVDKLKRSYSITKEKP